MVLNVLMRDMTEPRNPKIVLEMRVNDADVLPVVGDKVAHHVDKIGFQGARMSVVRTFDVVERTFYVKAGEDGEIRSIDYDLVNDGTEVDD